MDFLLHLKIGGAIVRMVRVIVSASLLLGLMESSVFAWPPAAVSDAVAVNGSLYQAFHTDLDHPEYVLLVRLTSAQNGGVELYWGKRASGELIEQPVHSIDVPIVTGLDLVEGHEELKSQYRAHNAAVEFEVKLDSSLAGASDHILFTHESANVVPMSRSLTVEEVGMVQKEYPNILARELLETVGRQPLATLAKMSPEDVGQVVREVHLQRVERRDVLKVGAWSLQGEVNTRLGPMQFVVFDADQVNGHRPPLTHDSRDSDARMAQSWRHTGGHRFLLKSPQGEWVELTVVQDQVGGGDALYTTQLPDGWQVRVHFGRSGPFFQLIPPLVRTGVPESLRAWQLEAGVYACRLESRLLPQVIKVENSSWVISRPSETPPDFSLQSVLNSTPPVCNHVFVRPI